jgi:hypothetical protein
MLVIMSDSNKELERWWVKEVVETISPLSTSFWEKKNAPLSFTKMERSLLPFGRMNLLSKSAGLQHRGNRLINMHWGDNGKDYGDGDCFPLSWRRSLGRRRGLLSLFLFCIIKGRVYTKWVPKVSKLWRFSTIHAP